MRTPAANAGDSLAQGTLVGAASAASFVVHPARFEGKSSRLKPLLQGSSEYPAAVRTHRCRPAPGSAAVRACPACHAAPGSLPGPRAVLPSMEEHTSELQPLLRLSDAVLCFTLQTL